VTVVKKMANYRFKATTITALAQAAEDDGRSSTGMAEKILTDWLKERGYL
jgi:hypothetical protein